MSQILARLKYKPFSLENLILLVLISFPMFVFILIITEKYVGIAGLIGIIFIVLVIQNYRYGLYFIVLGLPLFQSLSMKSDAASSTGINLQYILIPIVFASWLFEKHVKKELSKTALPFLSLLSFFVVALFLSLVNQMDVVAPLLLRHGFIQVYAFANYLLLFYIVVNEELSFEHIKKILWGFLIVAFVTSLIGLFQYFFASDPNLPNQALRITSTFQSFLRTNTKANPNAFGTYVAYMVVVAILLWNFTQIKKHRYLIIGMTGIVVIALALSKSRSSLLALIFVILCYTLVQNKKAFLIALFVSVIGLIALYFEPSFHRRIESIFTLISDKRVINMFLNINPWTLDWSYVEYYGIQGYNSDIISGAFRIWAWIQGVQLTLAHPILGIGYHMNRAYSPWPTAENLYLDIACMTGLAGLSLFLIMQYYFLRDGFRLLRVPKLTHIGMFWLNILAIVFIVSLTGSILFNGKLLGIFWILAGVFYNVKQREDDYLRQS